MIILQPSAGFVKATELDFKLLTFILSRFIRTRSRVVVKIHKSKERWSEFWPESKVIKIDLKQGTSLKYVVATLLHELRHYNQVRVFKSIRFNYDTYNEYYNSAEERDARKFEKLATDVCRIYNSYKSIEGKFIKFKFDSWKELGYTLGVDSNKLK